MNFELRTPFFNRTPLMAASETLNDQNWTLSTVNFRLKPNTQKYSYRNQLVFNFFKIPLLYIFNKGLGKLQNYENINVLKLKEDWSKVRKKLILKTTLVKIFCEKSKNKNKLDNTRKL